MGKRAVIYVRVSTDDQSKGYSLPTQLEACRHYAAERGYTVVDEFSDDYTGATLDRPGLNELRQFIANDPVGVMIVYDVDRLARKSIYQMIFEEELRQVGIHVEYVLGQYEDTDEGRLQKQIRASIAEYEKAKILERSKRGKRGKAKSGFVIVGARAPYGYRVKSEPHKAWLEVDEEEARVVRLVFDLYLRGDENVRRYTIRGVARRLTEMGIPTRGDRFAHFAKKLGHGVWQPAMITHILKNEAYIGVWYYGKTHIINDGKEATRKAKPKCGLGKQVAKPREEWIPVEVPRIIEDETWAAAQAQLESNKRELSGRQATNEYLLSRRLRCGHCGYGMRGQMSHGKYPYYLCTGARQIVSLCDMPTFPGKWVDDAVWAWVKELLQDPVQVINGLRASQAQAEETTHSLRERLEVIEAQIADYQRQLDKLLDLYLSGEFSKDLLAQRKARLEGSIADLSRERAEAKSQLRSETMSDDQVEDLETFCAEIRKGIDHATFEDQRRYLELLDVGGKLAVENGEKVVYVTCLIGSQRLLHQPILHL